MSTELDHARAIAERIARRVAGDAPATGSRVQTSQRAQAKPELTSELASVRAGLSELQRKIAQLEAKVSADVTSGPSSDPSNDGLYVASGVSTAARPAPLTHSPWLAGVNAPLSHPSQEKFGVEEAVVSELVDYFEKEKTCSVEPGGKPCDHCAMCSTRGF
jgi:BMFP domain-containing protein YqiC